MSVKELREKIDKAPCPTEHFKELEQIESMGGSTKLKIARAFVFGMLIARKGEKNG